MAGIDQLKQDLATLAKITKAVEGALEDGKISVAEGIGISFKAIDLIKVIKNLKELKEELLDLDVTEAPELAAYFAEVFDISNDKAEEVIEQIVVLAIQLLVSLDVFKND